MASALTCFSNLVKCFVTTELMRWPGIVSIYGEFLRKTPVFSSEKRWEDLHTRVIEHVRSSLKITVDYYLTIPPEHPCCG